MKTFKIETQNVKNKKRTDFISDNDFLLNWAFKIRRKNIDWFLSR